MQKSSAILLSLPTLLPKIYTYEWEKKKKNIPHL